MPDNFDSPDSSSGRIRLGLTQTASDSASSSLPARRIKNSLSHYSLLFAPGTLGGFLALLIYPPLDQGLLVTVGLCVLFLPFLLQLRSVIRKQLDTDASMLRKTYVSSSIVLAFLAAFLLLNGRLDKSPRTLVQTTLVHKSETRGRGGSTYTLTVSSWRGNRSENFPVDSRTFFRAVVGEPVTIELHQGYFGIPWSGKIFLH